jgi:beta-lactamase regulating signal transducer with metallopeptidase domain
MDWILGLLRWVGVPGDVTGWVVILVDVGLKSIVVVGAAGAVALGLRGASAALRHHVWAAALAGLLVLPLLSIVLPEWHLGFLPSVDRMGLTLEPRPSPEIPAPVVEAAVPAAVPAPAPLQAVEETPAESAPVPQPAPRGGSVGGAVSIPQAAGPGERPPSVQGAGAVVLGWSDLALIAWVVGASLVVALLALGMLRVWALARTAKPIGDEDFRGLAEAAADELGIERPVQLLESLTSITPMTWGYRRPVVLLPREARGWSVLRRRDVLLHELAHVRRNDYAMQLVARYTCAVYWFNPFVWLAARQLRRERERACDDAVLNAGTRPSEYANHLLEIARSLKASQSTVFATVAMARPSQLTGRLLDVLDDTRNRRGLSRSMSLLTWVGAFAVVLPLACAHPPQAAGAEVPGPLAAVAPEPDAALERVDPRGVADPQETGIERFDPRHFQELQQAGSQRFTIQNIECDPRRGDKHGSNSSSTNDRRTIEWWDGNCEGLVRIRGDVEFNEDFTDIVRLSRNGSFSIEIDDGETTWEVSLSEGRGGLERRWFVDRREQPYDADAAAWFTAALQDLFRRTTYKLDERVEWILQTRGVDGLLQEAGLAHSSYLRARLYEAAIATGELSAAQVARVFERAQTEIESDYEMSRLLRSVPTRYLQDRNLRRTYVQTADGLDSDYEKGRVLRAILTQQGLEDDLVLSMLASARDLDSDYELSRLLREIAGQYLHNDVLRQAYLNAAKDISSDYERTRVLLALFEQPNLTNAILLQILETAVTIDSDYELSRLLRTTAENYAVDANMRQTYFRAVNSISSDYERRRILGELLDHQNLSNAMVRDVLEAATNISSDHELSTILRGTAAKYVVSAELRPVFFNAVRSISSDYELRRVLQSVVEQQNVDRAVVLEAISAMSALSSDHEKAALLMDLGRRYRNDAEIVEALEQMADTLGSDYEYGRVMGVLRGRRTNREPGAGSGEL